MNNAGAKNKLIRHHNGHMILGISCKQNFEGEKKLPCTVQLQKFEYLLCQIHADLL